MAGDPRNPTRKSAMLHALPFAIVSALSFALAFPPFNLAILGPLALIPLVRLAQTAARARWAIVPVFLCYAIAFGWHHQWLFAVTAAGTPALLAYLALYPTLFVLILTYAAKRDPVAPWIAAPAIWLILEYLRGEWLFTGYPWFLIGHPFGPARDAHSLGLSLALIASGIGLFLSVLPHLKRPRHAFTIAATYCVIGAFFLSRDYRDLPPATTNDALTVAVIQTNVPQDNKIAWTLQQRIDDFDRMLALTREAAESEPDLIVWPETMFPGYTLSPDALQAARDANAAATQYDLYLLRFADALVETQRQLDIPLLIGAIGVDDVSFDFTNDEEPWTAGAIYNSVFLIKEGAIQPERYDKMHLTPFGEVMPYISAIDWLERALLAFGAGGMTFDLSAGSSPTVFQVETSSGKPVQIVTPICFEATMSEVCWQLAHAGSPTTDVVMINLTNDGWFGSFDPGREHHLLLARWRCTENRTPMIRAANTGISCAIDASGRVTDALPPRTEGVLVVEIPVQAR